MGDATLATQVTGTTITVDGVNQYKSALSGDVVPRNSAGAATDSAGSLGTDAIKWLKANIASGYWSAGDIKPHHSYNGTVPIDNGWFPCDGTIINETNYNIIHGAGAWEKYVITSLLDGKYAPNMIGKYPVGASATDQDGTSGITSVGNSSNLVDLSHAHTHTHNHQWYNFTSTAAGTSGTLQTFGAQQLNTYNSSGAAQDIDTSGLLRTDSYTSNVTTSTNSQLSSSTSIQPESIQTIYYIRII